jgi:hypothetical protein
MDPKPLNRQQLAKICGNDPEAIRLLERLFQVVGVVAPSETEGMGLAIPVDVAGQIDSLRSELQGYADLAQRAREVIEAAQLSGRDEAVLPDVVTPSPREFRRACYGQFYDTTTQTATTINTATPVSFDTTDTAAGVWLNGTEIRVAEPGVYNFQISFQLDKTSGGTGHFYIWFAKNGTAIPQSAGNVRIQGNNAEIFTAYNLFIPMGQDDWVEVVYSVDDLAVELKSFPASAPVPGIPSIILTVSNNIEGVK